MPFADFSCPASTFRIVPSWKGQRANSRKRQRWNRLSYFCYTSNQGLLSPLNHPGLFVYLLRENEIRLGHKDQIPSFCLKRQCLLVAGRGAEGNAGPCVRSDKVRLRLHEPICETPTFLKVWIRSQGGSFYLTFKKYLSVANPLT